MNTELIFSIVFGIQILLGAFLKGRALDRLFYLFVATILLIIFITKGLPLSLLFIGTIVPLFSRNKQTHYIAKNEKGSNKSMWEKLINYLCFAPLIGLGLMSYKIEQVEVTELSPVMIILGEVGLLVVTMLVISPKRLRVK